MAKEKIYKIGKQRIGKDDKETIVVGTLEFLKSYFGYTLKVGVSWNPKVNGNPKTIKSLVSNLQKSYAEQEAACYMRTFVRQIKD